MTGIQWTDETWNPVTGCTRVSEGCRHCYIERTPPFRMAGRTVGDPIQLHPDRLEQPLHWRKPRRVFVNSLSDLFHEDVPFEFIDQVFLVMGRTGWRNGFPGGHTYQVLTKRPERMMRYLLSSLKDKPSWMDHCSIVNQFLHNVWLGVSIEDQQTADERIPLLLQVPAAVRFVSAEPLLGPIDLLYSAFTARILFGAREGLDWVIVGGESGPQARPCNVSWIRAMVRQCQAATVPVFVKQLGSQVHAEECDFPRHRFWETMKGLNKSDETGPHLRHKKGGDPSEWPEDLRMREFPHAVLARAGVR